MHFYVYRYYGRYLEKDGLSEIGEEAYKIW